MISFIVPIHGWNAITEKCVQQIHKQLGKNELLLVADQCELPPLDEVRVVQTKKRSYAAGSRNLGANMAKHDIFVFIDSDVLVPNNFVAHCEATYTANQKQIYCFAMGPEVTNKKTAQFKGMLEWYSTHYVYQKPTDIVQQLQGYCCVITKSLYARTGGWIESRTMELEQYAKHIQQCGIEIVLAYTVLVKHYNHKGWKLFTTVFDRSAVWTKYKLKGTVDWDGKHKDPYNAIGSVLSFMFWSWLISPIIFVVWLFAHVIIYWKWLKFLYLKNNFFDFVLFALIHVLYLNTILLGAVKGAITR